MYLKINQECIKDMAGLRGTFKQKKVDFFFLSVKMTA